MIKRSWLLSATVCVSLGAMGCTPSSVLGDAAPKPPAVKDALGEDDCDQAAEVSEPLVVDMKDQDRAKVELALGKGVAVFRYSCDALELLPNCHVVEGDYNYLGFSKKERVVKLRSADELHANLPTLGSVWAVELGADLESDTSLDIALATVGLHATAVPQVARKQLRGSCDGATHFLKHAYIGAFAIEAGNKAKARAAVEVFGAGVDGATASSKFERITDGDLKSCAKAASDDEGPPPGCSAVLRLSLHPILDTIDPQKGSDGEPVCPAGMIRSGIICTADTTMARCRDRDLEACQSLCDSGDLDGCYYRAALDFDNEGPRTRALRALCDDENHWEACYTAATAMREVDLPSALPYYKKACQLGKGGHECRIWADDYLDHVGDKATKQDRRDALAAYRRTCSTGESLSCTIAGSHYIEPDPKRRVVEPDEQKAIGLFMDACFASDGACSTAAQLIEGRSWCEVTGSDPAFCTSPPSSSNPVRKDRARALTLFKRACADFSPSCAHLFRFKAFDDARIDKPNGPPVESYCKDGKNGDQSALYCALAAQVAQQENRPADRKVHLEKACGYRASLTGRKATVCKDLHIRKNYYDCRYLQESIDAAAWACAKVGK